MYLFAPSTHQGRINRLSKFKHISGDADATLSSEEMLLESSPKNTSIHSGGWCGFKPSDYGTPVRLRALAEKYRNTRTNGSVNVAQKLSQEREAQGISTVKGAPAMGRRQNKVHTVCKHQVSVVVAVVLAMTHRQNRSCRGIKTGRNI